MKPRPWWWHLVAALIIAGICATIWGLHLAVRALLDEPWASVVFIGAAVLLYATWMWWLDPSRMKARNTARSGRDTESGRQP